MNNPIGRDQLKSGVTILLSPKIANNFDKVAAIQKEILAHLGHPGCFSGRDFFFQYVQEEIFVAGEHGVTSALHG